jgi:hypothetical protein
MKTCRICGSELEEKEFYKIKHIYKYINFGRRIWCRTCQKLFMEMKQKELQEQKIKELKGNFDVSFI